MLSLMPARTRTALANKPAKARSAGASAGGLGALPEWNLNDLYSGMDDPQVKRDLDRADADSRAFEEAYKGKLATVAEQPGAGSALAQAVKRYEELDELITKIASYAGLVHAGD